MRSVKKDAGEVGKAAADFGNTARRLNEKDGPIDRLAEGTEALSHAADSFNAATLPRVNRVTEDTSRAVRQLGRTVNNINDNPQSLIYGIGRYRSGSRRARVCRTGGCQMRRSGCQIGSLRPPLLASLAGCATPDKPVRATLYDFGPGLTPPPACRASTRRRWCWPISKPSGALDGSAVLYRLGYADANQLRPYAHARWSAPPAATGAPAPARAARAGPAGAGSGRKRGIGARQRRDAPRPAHRARGVLALLRIPDRRAGACCDCAPR